MGNKCKHCRHRMAWAHGRGLCCRCYNDRQIRDVYPRKTPRGDAEDEGDFYGPAPLPLTSSAADPATKAGRAEKVAVMAMRADMGKELHHPDDVKKPIEEAGWLPPRAREGRMLQTPAGGGWQKRNTTEGEAWRR